MTLILAMFLLAAPVPSSVALNELVAYSAQANLPAGASSIKLLALRRSDDLPAFLDPRRVAVHFRPGEDFSGSTVVQIEFDGKSRWLMADFELLVPSCVAHCNLPRNHILSPSDLQIVPRPLRLQHGNYPLPPEALVGRALINPVKAGQPILRAMLKRPVAIRRGQRVELIVHGSGLTLRAVGISLADGRIGDSIPVKNTDSGRRVQGQVSAPRLVTISLAGNRFGAAR